MLINDPSRPSFGEVPCHPSQLRPTGRGREALFSPGRVEISENQRKSIRCVFTQERAPCALLEENSENLLPDTDQSAALSSPNCLFNLAEQNSSQQKSTTQNTSPQRRRKILRVSPIFSGKTNNTHLLFLLQLVLLFCAPEREKERRREVTNSLATCTAHVETKRSSWHP